MKEESRDSIVAERKFVALLAVGAAAAAAIPAFAALSAKPPTAMYLGTQWATDDQMVYAAWMRQAMDGHLLMDNRFTTASQPGLTIHLYFFVLGLLARFLGIIFVSNIARIGLCAGFVFILHKIVLRLDATFYARKLAIALAVFGGGLGFLEWHTFGEAIVRPGPEFLAKFLMGRLPTDVWQPEGFVFPSMLTNGLFVVSLCLIGVIFLAVLTAQRTSRWVIHGMVAALILMNIHSYDVLLVAITVLGLGVMQAVRKSLSAAWAFRTLAIAAGAIPSALWFLYVLSHDPVFQARAATETYSPNFRQVLFGYFPMMALAFVAFAMRSSVSQAERNRRLAGAGLAALILVGMTFAAKDHVEGYFMGPVVWVGIFVAALGSLALMADENPTWNLIASWALLGTVAMYFPGLFQRKLAMGLSIPWALLAAMSIAHLVRNQERNSRNLATVLVVLVFSATSLLWVVRELSFVRNNVSRTTELPVYLNQDVVQILNYLNSKPGRKVVLAPPGEAARPIDAATGLPEPDMFVTPAIPDLNPIVSGLSGSYSFAGHWSETPDYMAKRRILSLLYRQGPADDRLQKLHEIGADYVVAPVPEAFPQLSFFDYRTLGDIVVDGNQFRLIRVRP